MLLERTFWTNFPESPFAEGSYSLIKINYDLYKLYLHLWQQNKHEAFVDRTRTQRTFRITK